MVSFVKKENPSSPPGNRRTLSKKSLTEKLSFGSYLFLAFFVPFILMFTAFAIAKVSPFGDNQILVTDLWHQYYPFLTDYQSKLQSGGSLLWTWKSGGGTNYLALMAYYLASPLNFFSALVPPEYLREFLYVITCVKIGLAGMFFALFLRITFNRRDVVITAFGIMYALCAYIMGYYWNVIWLDTIALLPLVIAGTIALLKHGRFRLYIITLALSILANYYIGLFTCIFVMLVSIGYTIVEYKGWRKTLRDFYKMVGCTIVSIMISAVLTLPAYLALKHTQSSSNTFPQNFAVNMGGSPDLSGVLEGLGKTISNSIAFVSPTAKEGLPNIYCGVFTIFLAILFLFCSKIKKRERIICAGLLVFFMLSFVVRQLDFIWHGFHFPNMLPYRFSFLYSFVLIYMAFRVFTNLDSLKPASVIAAIFGFAVYLGIAAGYYFTGSGSTLSALYTTDPNTKPNPIALSAFFGLVMAAWVLLYSFRSRLPRQWQAIFSALIGIGSLVFIVLSARAFIAPMLGNDSAVEPDKLASTFTIIAMIVMSAVTAAIFIALYSKQLNSGNRMLKTMLSLILVALALAEGMFSAAAGVKAVGVTGGSYYPLGSTNTLAMVDEIKEREKDSVDLYHTEVNKYYTLNDNALIGVNGISIFNSMVNSRITDYMEKFGICGWIASNRYTYQESSPFTNLMLNLKYLIAPYGAYLDKTHMTEIDVPNTGAVRLMENNYYLPMGFMVDSDLLNYDISALPAAEPMDNQNLFFRLATGLDGDLYEYLDDTSFTCDDGAAIGDDNGSGRYTYNSSDSSGSYKINFTAPRKGTAVAYYDTYYSDNVSLMVNDSEVISYYVKRPFIMMIGDVEAGDTITCSASITSASGSINCRVALLNEDLFQQAYELFGRSTLNASKVTDDTIQGNITVAEDGLFYTSISYVEGWQAFVDGQEVEITPVGGAMLAFKLSKGTHIIELRYTPEGFKVGLIVCIAGLLILIAMCILSWRKINLINLLYKGVENKPTAAKVVYAIFPNAMNAAYSPGKAKKKRRKAEAETDAAVSEPEDGPAHEKQDEADDADIPASDAEEPFDSGDSNNE